MKHFLAILVLIVLVLISQLNAQINYSKIFGNDKILGIEAGAAIEFSTTGEIQITGEKTVVSTWITSTNQLIKRHTLKGIRGINGIALLGSDTVYVSSEDNTILAYDLKQSSVIGQLKQHFKKVTCIELDSDQNRLFSSSMDKTTILWNTADNSIVQKFQDHESYVLATAIDHKEGKLASCGADGILNVYSKEGQNIFSKKLTTDWLWSLSFTYDGKYLAVGGENKIYVLSDLISQNPKITPIEDIKGKAYCLDFSPDGKYLGVGTTEEQIYLIDWQKNLKIMTKKVRNGPVIDLEFQPDGKNMVTSHGGLRGIMKWDLRSLNILPIRYLKNITDKTGPQIYVSNPEKTNEERITVFTDIVKIQGSVIDESGINKVLVNKVNTPVSEDGSFVINIPLAYSENPVRIEAYDINNNASLKQFTILRKDPSGTEYNPELAKNYLLVIGINKYEKWNWLDNSVKDAKEIAETLIRLYKFDSSNITFLLDSLATGNNIIETLRNYAEKIGSNDNLMIYFSGHGYFDAVLSEGYWVPVEAGKKAIKNFLSNSELLKIVKSINSQHTLIVADACFSGSLFNESIKGLSDNVEKFKSRWGLASGRLEEVRDGTVGGNSPFARAILDFLRFNTQQKTAVSELILYVKKRVSEDSEQTPIGNPLKNVGDEGGEFVFYKR